MYYQHFRQKCALITKIFQKQGSKQTLPISGSGYWAKSCAATEGTLLGCGA